MCRLNYSDLLALVIEYDIDAIQSLIQLESGKSKSDKNVVEATNKDILAMHRKKVS